MTNTLYTKLENIEEYEENKTIGEDIIDTFYNGNFTDGIKHLIKNNVSPKEFGSYIEETILDLGYENKEDFANNHFDYEFWISLGEEYNNIRRGI